MQPTENSANKENIWSSILDSVSNSQSRLPSKTVLLLGVYVYKYMAIRLIAYYRRTIIRQINVHITFNR